MEHVWQQELNDLLHANAMNSMNAMPGNMSMNVPVPGPVQPGLIQNATLAQPSINATNDFGFHQGVYSMLLSAPLKPLTVHQQWYPTVWYVITDPLCFRSRQCQHQ